MIAPAVLAFSASPTINKEKKKGLKTPRLLRLFCLGLSAPSEHFGGDLVPPLLPGLALASGAWRCMPPWFGLVLAWLAHPFFGGGSFQRGFYPFAALFWVGSRRLAPMKKKEKERGGGLSMTNLKLPTHWKLFLSRKKKNKT